MVSKVADRSTSINTTRSLQSTAQRISLCTTYSAAVTIEWGAHYAEAGWTATEHEASHQVCEELTVPTCQVKLGFVCPVEGTSCRIAYVMYFPCSDADWAIDSGCSRVDPEWKSQDQDRTWLTVDMESCPIVLVIMSGNSWCYKAGQRYKQSTFDTHLTQLAFLTDLLASIQVWSHHLQL
jgi:hypothetical protein